MEEMRKAQSIALALGIPLATIENKILSVEDQDLEAIVPRGFALNREVLPLFLDGSTLALAMVDPMDEETLETIRLDSGLHVQPFAAAPTQLRAVAAKFYD